MHLSNILVGQSLFQTIMQIIQATSIGILFGSIYYKSKNIWSVIFLHGLYDFSIMLSDVNVIKECTYGTPTTSIAIYSTFSSILIILFYVFNAVLVLRTTDLKDKSKGNKDNTSIVIAIVAIFMLMLMPFGIFVKGYDEYEICYNYDVKTVKNYDFEKHYPSYREYYISSERSNDLYSETELFDYVFEVKDDYVLLTNKITKENIKLEFNDMVSFYVLNNDNKYTLIAYTNDGYNSEVYYSDFINQNNISNDKKYLNMIKDSFKKYELPAISIGGYVTFKNDNYKYPYFLDSSYNHFMLDKDNKLFKIEGED